MTAAPAAGSATAAIRGMPSSIETFGARIRRLRKARGMTREAFANACGTTVQCIAQWEIRTTPRVPVLPRVAAVLGVSLDYLISGEKSLDHAALVRAVRVGASREQMLALIGPLDE